MNTQALGMIYWGLSKLYPNSKTKFHKKTELWLSETVRKLGQAPQELTLEQPVDVYDQIIQTCGVMLYS